MKQRIGLVLVLGLALPVMGCDALLGLIQPTTVTVTLVNESAGFDVDLTLFYHDDEDVFEVILTQFGTERNFTLSPGETQSFTRSCDDLRAIIIEDAELQVPLLSPDADTEVYRMGEDFECGDEIIFTFTHSPLIQDFDVVVDVVVGTPLLLPF